MALALHGIKTAKSHRAAEEEPAKHRERLEKLVEMRTAELTKANIALQAEEKLKKRERFFPAL